VISPSGDVIDATPNYGIGRTLEYTISDQAGNPMSTGVLLKETVSPSNAQAQAMTTNVDVNKQPVRPDNRGIVPDTVGAISPNPRSLTYLQQNQVDALFSQTITVYGAVGREYRTALTLNIEYRLTNAGVTLQIGTVTQHKRPN
jgi:hypothetical protein